MKHLKITLFIFTIAALFACTKYEEGPKISLKRTKKKLVGTWEFSYIKDDTTNISYNPIKYYFGDIQTIDIRSNMDISIDGKYTGVLTKTDLNKHVYGALNDSTLNNTPNSAQFRIQILRLTKDELIFRPYINANIYIRYVFTKK